MLQRGFRGGSAQGVVAALQHTPCDAGQQQVRGMAGTGCWWWWASLQHMLALRAGSVCMCSEAERGACLLVIAGPDCLRQRLCTACLPCLRLGGHARHGGRGLWAGCADGGGCAAGLAPEGCDARLWCRWAVLQDPAVLQEVGYGHALPSSLHACSLRACRACMLRTYIAGLQSFPHGMAPSRPCMLTQPGKASRASDHASSQLVQAPEQCTPWTRRGG